MSLTAPAGQAPAPGRTILPSRRGRATPSAAPANDAGTARSDRSVTRRRAVELDRCADVAPAESRRPRGHGEEDAHVSETPATQCAAPRRASTFSEHVYDYVEHGGTAESARQLGVDEHAVVKTAGDAGRAAASR